MEEVQVAAGVKAAEDRPLYECDTTERDRKKEAVLGIDQRPSEH